MKRGSWVQEAGLTAIVLCIAAVLGVLLATVGGWRALLLLGAGIGGLAVLRWPFLGLLLFALTIPIENLLTLEAGATASRLLGTAIFGAWFVGKLVRGESFDRVVTSGLAIAAASFVALIFASSLWASVPQVAVRGGVQMVQFVALAVLTLDLVRSWERLELIAQFVLVGAAVAAALTLQQYVSGSYRRAGSDIAGGVNATAVVLVTALPLAFYLLAAKTSQLWKVFGLAYIALAIPAVFLTFSRMNLLLLGPLLTLLYWDMLKRETARRWLIPLTCAGVAAAAFFVPLDRVEQRAQTIIPYIQGTIDRDAPDVDESGRGYHMRIGFAIAREHPYFGAGYRNYGHLFRDEYQHLLPRAGRLYQSVRSPHSSHVGMLADLGLFGFTIWLILCVGVGFGSAVIGWRLTRSQGLEQAHLLTRAVTYAVALQVFAYGWYRMIHLNKLFWLVMGCAVVVGELARRRAAHPPDEPLLASSEEDQLHWLHEPRTATTMVRQ